MKRIWFRHLGNGGLLLALALLLFPLKASATIIPDTSGCEPLEISLSTGGNAAILKDASYSSALQLGAGTEITVHAAQKLHGLYIIWDSLVPEWELKIGENSYTCGRYGFLHEYIELPEESDTLTIVVPDGSFFNGQDGSVKGGMRIADLYGFASAEVPDWVQRWEPVCSDADIMFIPTHADDEHLFFGGILPIYQAERKLKVQTVFFTQHWVFNYTTKIREHERLNGLWTAGAVYYPILGSFRDAYSRSLSAATQSIRIEDGAEFLTRVIRQVRPMVVVTHDFNGEYGHGQHMLVARATASAVENARDAAYDPDSFEQFGTWSVAKLYIHLYDKADTVLDLRAPLEAFEGRSAFDVATAAYKMHESQQPIGYHVSDTDPVFNARYGLYRSRLGADAKKNDFMEHITAEYSSLCHQTANVLFKLTKSPLYRGMDFLKKAMQ